MSNKSEAPRGSNASGWSDHSILSTEGLRKPNDLPNCSPKEVQLFLFSKVIPS